MKNTNIYQAKNFQDVLYNLKNIPNLQIKGSGTQDVYFNQETSSPILYINNISELNTIEKKERYIDFGSAVTLTQIISLGKTKIPSFLYDAINTVGNVFLRNIATLGGNLCCRNRAMTLFSPFLALDARLEIRNPTEIIYKSMSKFTGINEKNILTKIRIPLDDWDISIFSKCGPEKLIDDTSASFTFLAKSQKNLLTDLRISFCGKMILRNRELENRLIGTRLPLSRKAIDLFVDAANKLYRNEKEIHKINCHPILKDEFLSLLKHSLMQLT